MKKDKFPILSLLVFLIAACATPPTGEKTKPEGAGPASKGPPRIAVLIVAEDLESSFVEEIMIGVSRTAQEFEGTIVGREGTISFGEKLEFTVIPTARDKGEIEDELWNLDLAGYSLVFGCGFLYRDPLIAVHREFLETHFVIVDTYGDVPDEGKNLTNLEFHMTDAAFLAGVAAAAKVGGKPIGFIGGRDLSFIRDEFLAGFVQGVEYADSLQGTYTELRIEFVGSFNDREQGYQMAMAMYSSGVECIYQAAGLSGIGVLDAAGEVGKWSIGVDTDQGLEFAEASFGEWILTSTVKRWGTGLYLVCKEFLSTGKVPPGSHVVGLAEGCVDIAINPYNTPNLLNQWDLIASVRGDLERGNIPSAVKSEETTVWKSRAEPAVGDKISITVNNPEFSTGIDTSYGPTLQKALSTAFHETGRYRVISRQQRDRLLEEISASLDITSDEKKQLEVGRLIAAEAIVFVDLSIVGSKYILDTKIVDVGTGITIAASSEDSDDIEQIFEGLAIVVRNLGN